MLQNLYLFSTGRALQQFYMQQPQILMPYAMLWGEFLQKFFITDKRILPQNFRKIFLSIASTKVETRSLEFSTNFLQFLHDCDFVLPFFDELAHANVDFKKLATCDTYDEYGDHLMVLEQLYKAYLSELNQYGFCDLTLQKGEFLVEMLAVYEKIEFFLDGFLSAYECSILDSIAAHRPLILHIESDCYNLETLKDITLCNIQENYRYIIDFNHKKIIHQSAKKQKTRTINGYAFATPLNQVALCLDTLSSWIAQGIDANDIAIVLPDEKFKDFLKLFDIHRNFNYAMGESQSQSHSYHKLESLFNFLTSKEILENIPSEFACAASIDECGLDAVQRLMQIFSTDANMVSLLEDLHTLYAEIADLLAPLHLTEMLQIILLEIAHRRIDDIGGGKIRVLGILETRGIDIKAVIVLNMNDGLIPRPNNKDIFLNSSIRKHAGLPTYKDRENLQKHYYYSLLYNAEHSVISWVNNDMHYESTLILEQEMQQWLHINRIDGETLYKNTLFPHSIVIKNNIETFTMPLPKDFRLSYSKLKTFLQCKSAFYYRYIEKLEEVDNQHSKIGLFIHHCLAESYKSSQNPKQRQKTCYDMLSCASLHDVDTFEIKLIGRYLESFFQQEQARYEKGIRTKAIEQHFHCELNGFGIDGIIDRIDTDENGLILIDYKLRKNFAPDSKDGMQLALYAEALKQDNNDAIHSVFYDLYKSRFIDMPEKSHALLFQTLDAMKGEIQFYPTKNSSCRFCPYKEICGLHT